MAQPYDHGGAHGSHEARDVTFRPLVLAGIGLFVLIVATFLGMRGLLAYYVDRGERAAPAPNSLASSVAGRLPPEPRLQTHPRRDLREQRAGEDAVLKSYGWVDQESQIVRIPIDRAMELLAQRATPPAAVETGGAP